MINTNTTQQLTSPEEVKKMVVEALNIGHLPASDQDSIIGELAGALMERATLALLKEVPESEFDAIDALADSGKDAEMVEALRKVVPNAQEIMEEAIRSGVEEYKILVNEQVKARLEKEMEEDAQRVGK